MNNNFNIMEDKYSKYKKMIYSRYYLDLIDFYNGIEFHFKQSIFAKY